MLVFVCGMLRFLESRGGGDVVTESRHEEGLAGKQGLYQRKRSDKVLTTCTRYVFGWVASEEF